MSRGKKKKKALAKLSFRQRWIAWHQTNGPVLRFCLKLAAMMAAFYILMALPWGDRWLYSYLQANAWASNIVLNCLGQHTALSEVTVSSSRFSVTIERGCDAVEPTWLFCAAVISFPAPWAHKFVGMLAGMIFLQVLNLVRIVTLFLVGAYIPSVFNASHMEIWPVVFVLVAIVLFAGWREWTAQRQINHVAV